MMSVCTALSLLFASAASVRASDAEDGTLSAGPDQAEYVRLQQEIERLAQRNAWAGVERTYDEMLATGIPLAFEDHLAGAHAARALGDVWGARQRLTAANAVREGDREILEWLWDIDSHYGRVSLSCNPGKHQVEMTAEAMPFNPDQRRAVEFAIAEVRDTCLFDGLLPQGNYRFGTYDVKVQKVQAVRLDLRNMEVPSTRKSKKSKTKDDATASE